MRTSRLIWNRRIHGPDWIPRKLKACRAYEVWLIYEMRRPEIAADFAAWSAYMRTLCAIRDRWGCIDSSLVDPEPARIRRAA